MLTLTTAPTKNLQDVHDERADGDDARHLQDGGHGLAVHLARVDGEELGSGEGALGDTRSENLAGTAVSRFKTFFNSK